MITVKTQDLQKALKHVLSTTAKNYNNSNILSCVCMKVLDNNLLELVSTDGNVLSLDRIKFEGDAGQFLSHYIINNFEQITKCLDKSIKVVHFDVIGEKLILSQYNNNFELSLQNGNYPKYENLINNYNIFNMDAINYTPDDNTIKVGVNRKFLLNLLKTMDATKCDTITIGIKHNSYDFQTTNNALYINNKYSVTDNNIMQFNLLMPIQLR